MENKLLEFPNFEKMDLLAIAEGREPNDINPENKDEDKGDKSKEEKEIDDTKKEYQDPIDPTYRDLNKLLEEQEKEVKKTSNYEEEEEKEDKDKDKSSSSKKETSEEVTEIIAKFKEAVEFGTFIVPEDFEFDGTEDKFNEALEHTRNHYIQEAEEQITSSIKDPLLKEIIDYGMKGGQFANLNLFGQYQQVQNNFENADIENEEVQKQIVRAYYETTAAALGADKINKLVDEEVDSGKLKETATQYQNWFVQEAKAAKAELDRKAKAQRDAEIQAAQEYNKKFQQALDSTNFAKTKKQEILSSFQTVKTQDGNEVLNWHNQLMQVQNNPEHFILLLDILNTYNPKEGFSFGVVESKIKEKERKTIFDKFKGKKESDATSSTRQTTEEKVELLRNPADRYVTKI